MKFQPRFSTIKTFLQPNTWQGSQNSSRKKRKFPWPRPSPPVYIDYRKRCQVHYWSIWCVYVCAHPATTVMQVTATTTDEREGRVTKHSGWVGGVEVRCTKRHLNIIVYYREAAGYL